MIIRDFTKKYNELTHENNKANLIKTIIKRTYCPVLEKMTILQLMLDKSVIKPDKGGSYIDMFVNKINFIAAIISLYTNLEVEKDDDGNVLIFEAYDQLVSNNLLIPICEEIGRDEMEELTNINQMLMDTYYNQNNVINLFYDITQKAASWFGVAANIGLEKIIDKMQGTASDTH